MLKFLNSSFDSAGENPRSSARSKYVVPELDDSLQHRPCVLRGSPVQAHPGLVEGQRREAADGHVVARLLHQGRDIGAQRLDLRARSEVRVQLGL